MMIALLMYDGDDDDDGMMETSTPSLEIARP